MPDHEKRPWFDVAGHDRARYDAEMKNYNNPLLREAGLFDDQVVLSLWFAHAFIHDFSSTIAYRMHKRRTQTLQCRPSLHIFISGVTNGKRSYVLTQELVLRKLRKKLVESGAI